MRREYRFRFQGSRFSALPEGALWWPERRLLCVADMHLGKAGRLARRKGVMLPPYETRETLARLLDLVRRCKPGIIVCLGDSFDDAEAARELASDDRQTLAGMAAGRHLIWIAGNHDPSADWDMSRAGSRDAQPWESRDASFRAGNLRFRHIADHAALGEVSGHYHPKIRISAQGRSITRPCFLIDDRRIVLPAFGLYTGGLDCREPPLSDLMSEDATAVLTGDCALPVPISGGR